MQPRGCLRFFVFGIALIAAAFCFTSCTATSTPAGRAAQSPGLAASLPPAHREAALQGRLLEGMSPDAVVLAWGKPDSVTGGHSGGTKMEIWRYTTLQSIHRPYYERPNYLYRNGHYQMLPPRVIDMSPELMPRVSGVVRFRNGRVSAWEQR